MLDKSTKPQRAERQYNGLPRLSAPMWTRYGGAWVFIIHFIEEGVQAIGDFIHGEVAAAEKAEAAAASEGELPEIVLPLAKTTRKWRLVDFAWLHYKHASLVTAEEAQEALGLFLETLNVLDYPTEWTQVDAFSWVRSTARDLLELEGTKEGLQRRMEAAGAVRTSSVGWSIPPELLVWGDED